MVHRARQQEITSVVEVDFPNRLAVLGEGLGATFIYEVPDLDSAVSGGGSKEIASRMERDAPNPVEMSFATHDQVAIGH